MQEKNKKKQGRMNHLMRIFMTGAVFLFILCIAKPIQAQAETANKTLVWGPGNVTDLTEKAQLMKITLPSKGTFFINFAPDDYYLITELYNADMTKRYGYRGWISTSNISSRDIINDELDAGTYILRYWTVGGDCYDRSFIATFTPSETASMDICVNLKHGKTLQLGTIITNNSDKKVTWTSSNKKVAAVSQKGTVKGIKKGKVTIKAYNSSGLVSTVKVKVL